MDLYELLRRRRMVRSYLPDPIPDQALQRVLEAALRGPSAGYSQGVSLVVVRDPGRRQAIANMANEEAYVQRGYPAWLSKAPVHLVLCVEPERYRERYRRPDKLSSKIGGETTWPIPYWHVDGGAALMLILLAAVEEGLAAGFQGAHNLGPLPEFLSIPSQVQVLGLVTLGYAAPDPRPRSIEQVRRQSSSAIHHETWESDRGNLER